MVKPLHKLVAEYSNAVGRYGPDSEQARQFRAAHADNKELMGYADALDRIKRHLGGSGIDDDVDVDFDEDQLDRHNLGFKGV